MSGNQASGGGPRPKFRCLICGRLKVKGTFIRNGFLCARCESELTSTSVDDPTYARYVDRIRKLWPDAAQLSAGETDD